MVYNPRAKAFEHSPIFLRYLGCLERVDGTSYQSVHLLIYTWKSCKKRYQQQPMTKAHNTQKLAARVFGKSIPASSETRRRPARRMSVTRYNALKTQKRSLTHLRNVNKSYLRLADGMISSAAQKCLRYPLHGVELQIRLYIYDDVWALLASFWVLNAQL